jgi:acyl carrier protein
MRRRPELSDAEFYSRFYAGADVPKKVAIRMRGLYAEQLGIINVRPSDRATDFDEELDFHDVLLNLAEEFKIEISDESAERLAEAATFDELVRYVATKPFAHDSVYLDEPSVVAYAIRRRRKSLVVGVAALGILAVGFGMLLDKVVNAVPGVSVVLKAAGILTVIVALSQGEYRSRQ